MSKPSKRLKTNSASLSRWDAALMAEPLSDDVFKLSVGFLIPDSPERLTDIGLVADCIATRLRRRFFAISRDELIGMAQDEGKATAGGGKKGAKGGDKLTATPFSEVCEHVRQALSSGGQDAITPSLEARLLKYYLLKRKREHLTKKDATVKGSSGEPAAGKGARGESRKGAKSVKGVKGSPKKGAGDAAKESDAPMPVKPETKLKKRGEEEDLIKSLDDEPEDGADIYVVVHGLCSTTVLQQCVEVGVPVDCLLEVVKEDNDVILESPQGDTEGDGPSLVQQTKLLKKFWTDIGRILKSSAGYPMRHMALLQVRLPKDSIPEAPEKKADYAQLFFDELADQFYQLQEKKRQYELYLQSLQVIQVPHQSDPSDVVFTENASKEVDLRLYNWLMDAIPAESGSIPMMMHCMLEQAVANVDDGGSARELTSMEDENSVKALLDKFILKLSLPTDDKKMLLGDADKLRPFRSSGGPTILRNGDEASSRTMHLRSVDGFDPAMAEARMLQLLPYYQFRDFSLFHAGEVDPAACRGRKHEMEHMVTEAGVDSALLGHSLKQFAFEAMNLQRTGKPPEPLFSLREKAIVWDDPYTVPGKVNANLNGMALDKLQLMNFDEWCVEEHLEPSIFLQVLREARDELPFVDKYYHKTTDSLLLVFHNPAMATEKVTGNEFQWSNWIHSPVGFSNYLRHVSTFAGNVVDKAYSMAVEEAEAEAKRIAKEHEEAEAKAAAAVEKEAAASAVESEAPKSRQQSRSSSRKDKDKPPSEARSNVSSRSSTRKAKEKEKPAGSAKGKRKGDAASRLSADGTEATTAETASAVTVGIPKLFLAYDVGDRVLRATGNVRQVFSPDGGVVTMKRWGFVDGVKATCFSVEKDGCSVTLHRIPNDDDDGDDDEDDDNGDDGGDQEKEENAEVLADGTENDVDGDTLKFPPPAPKLPCKFSSFVVRFNDGTVAAISKLGRDGGQPVNKNSTLVVTSEKGEVTLDVPSQGRNAATQKGGGGKKKDAAAEQALLEQQRLQEEESERRRQEEEEAKRKQKWDEALRPKYQELFISTPDGLHVDYNVVHEGEVENLREDSHLDGGRVVVRMRYAVKTRAVQPCEGARATAMKEELSRCVTKEGTIVKLMKDGSTAVLFAGGSVSVATAANAEMYAARADETAETTEQQENDEVERSHSPSRRVTFSGGAEDEVTMQPPEVPDIWMTTAINGDAFLHRAERGDGPVFATAGVMAYLATDPESNEMMVSRADGVTIVRRPDGSSVVEHADGTRITTFDDGDRAFVRVEHPAFVTLTFDRETGSCRTTFGNGASIALTNRGEYCLEHPDGNVVDIAYDGEVCFVPKSASVHSPAADDELLSGAYVLHPTKEMAVQFGNIAVLEDGTVEGEDSGRCPTPRLFVLQRDGSGTALMRKSDVAEFLSVASADPSTAILTDSVEGLIGGTAITVLKPKSAETWTTPYAEKIIIPSGLRDRQFENVDDSERDPEALVFRQLIEFPELTAESRLQVMDGFCQFLHWRDEETKVGRSLLLPDPRSDDEKAEAAKLKAQLMVRDTTLSGAETGVIFNAAKEFYQGKSDEELLQKYGTVTKMPSESNGLDLSRRSVGEKSRARLESHRREIEELEASLKALRERSVPSYFDMPQGKEFLESALKNGPDMKALTSQLPSQSAPSRPGGVSEMELYPANSSRSLTSGVDSAIDPGRATTHTPTTVGDAGADGSPNGSGGSPQASVYLTPSLSRIPELQSDVSLSTARPLNPTPAKALTGSAQTAVRPENPTPAQASNVVSKRPANPTPGIAMGDVDELSPEKIQDTVSEPGDCRHLAPDRPRQRLSFGGGAPLPSVGKSSLLDVTGKPRKQSVKLPTSITGSKPGARPNDAFDAIEEPVRRKLATSSVAGLTARGSGRLNRGFEILPAAVDFGVLREGYTYSYPVTMRNVGIDSCRFKLKQPPPSTGIKIVYSPGPVAAGMMVSLDVEIFAVAVGAVGNTGVGSVEHTLEITTETDILSLPIGAVVMTAIAYEHQTTDERSSNVPHPKVQLLSNKPPSRETLVRSRKLHIAGEG